MTQEFNDRIRARQHAQWAEEMLEQPGGGESMATTHASLAVYYQLRHNDQSLHDTSSLLSEEVRLLKNEVADLDR